MVNTIQIKRSNVAGKVPTAAALEVGELALNFPDKKLYTKEPGGTVIELEGNITRIIDVNDANPGLRITQVGTGEALRVEDEANPDATPFVVDASGNVGIGISAPPNKLSIVGAKINGFVSAGITNTDASAGSISQFVVAAGGGATGEFFARGNTDVSAGSVSNHPFILEVNNIERARIDTSGSFLMTGSGVIGYGVNTGGTVMQGPNKNTAVAIHKRCGEITTGASNLAGGASETFTVNNNLMTADSVVVLTVENINYSVRAHSGAGGSFGITIKNENVAALAQSVNIRFAIFKINLT